MSGSSVSTSTSPAPELHSTTTPSPARNRSNSNSFLSDEEQREYALLTNDVSTEHIDQKLSLLANTTATTEHGTVVDEHTVTYSVDNNEQTTVASENEEKNEFSDLMKISLNFAQVICPWC